MSSADSPARRLTTSGANGNRVARNGAKPHDSAAVPNAPVPWDGSEAEVKARKNRRSSFIYAGVTIGVTVLFGAGQLLQSELSAGSFPWPGLVAALFAYIGLALLAVTPLSYRTARKKFEERQELIQAATQSREALSDVIHNPGIESLLGLNRADTEQYHKITRLQAERSFKNGQIAMFFGFFVVIGGAVVVVFPIDLGAKIAVGALSIVGGSIASYINKTFQKSHAQSLAQLNSFFRQPLVQSYLLTAERVAVQLEKDERGKALGRIVDQAITSANSADAIQPTDDGSSRSKRRAPNGVENLTTATGVAGPELRTP